jgi:hypothetical protein
MRARDAYRLIVRRGGRAPAVLAGPGRVDHVEVVGVEDGEVVFFWDLAPREAGRLVRLLREDLATLDAESFRGAWAGAASEHRGP